MRSYCPLQMTQAATWPSFSRICGHNASDDIIFLLAHYFANEQCLAPTASRRTRPSADVF